MRLANTTDITDERIREIIQFVKPSNLSITNVDVRVTNCSGYYQGKCYSNGCGYAKKGIGSDLYRPLIIARITPNENNFPYQENHTPTRTIKLDYERYNEKKGKWEVWRSTRYLAISEAYISRKNKELRDKGKFYDWNKSTGGYIDCFILSREEALVHILAHELKHLWQKNHPGKRGRVWGARGQFSDRDADAYAIKKMREWRMLHAADIYKEQPDMIPSVRDGESRMRGRLETGKCFDKSAPSYPTIKNIAEPEVEFRTQPTLPTMNFPNKQDKCCDTCGVGSKCQVVSNYYPIRGEKGGRY